MVSASQDHVVVAGLAHVFERENASLEALRDVDLRIGWGEFVSVIGPSGCGKSTLLRIVGGLLAPTEGLVSLGGRPPDEAQRRKEIGYVFQDPSLLPWRSVIDNVRLPLEVNRRDGDGISRDPSELLALVGLDQFRSYRPKELSGGMQQRVALARALVFNPSLLLMDEPLGALDEITRRSMRYELLRVWSAAGEGRKTAVFVTHSISEAVALSDRVVVLSGSPGTVRAVIDIDLPRPRGEEMETRQEFMRYEAVLRKLLREPVAA